MVSLPTYRFKTILRPSQIDGFMELLIIEQDDKDRSYTSCARQIRVEDLKNRSFMDYAWEAMRNKMDQIIAKELGNEK